MKLALAMCAAGPMWLAPIFAVPSTVSPSTATTVRAGGVAIHMSRARSSETSLGHVKVSPAATMSRRKGQICAQSPSVASLIRMASRLGGPGNWFPS